MNYFNKIMLFILLVLGCNSIFAFNGDSNFKHSYNGWFNELQQPMVDQVISNEQGVFLLINDFWLCTEAFQITGLDSFVLLNGEWLSLSEAIESGTCHLSSWKCKRCERYNLEGVNACAYCGKPRYE